MEITYFVLGIVTVIAVAMGVGMVWAITQIVKLKSESQSDHRDVYDSINVLHHHVDHLVKDLEAKLEKLNNHLDQEVADIYDGIEDNSLVTEDLIDKVYSVMDSRFDKLEAKIVKKEMLNG